MRVPNWLWPARKLSEALPQDGFGQSLFDDARFMWRFRGCRLRAASWCAPSDGERMHYDVHPLFGRFGDATTALAIVDGRTWIIRERDWHGWPDPPRFVFFALKPEGSIWCARDFHVWPQAWVRPGDEI